PRRGCPPERLRKNSAADNNQGWRHLVDSSPLEPLAAAACLGFHRAVRGSESSAQTDALRRMPGWDSPAAAALYHPESRTSVHTSRPPNHLDRKSTRLNSSHDQISYAVFCLKK